MSKTNKEIELTENQLGYFAGIDEWIKWLNFEFDKFDIITKENKRASKVRFLFLNDLMDKREELKIMIKDERLQKLKGDEK